MGLVTSLGGLDWLVEVTPPTPPCIAKKIRIFSNVLRDGATSCGNPEARLLSAPVTVDPDIPRRVAQARHDIEDLYALQTTANNALNTLQPEPLAVRRVLADPPRRVGMADVRMYEQTLLQGQQRRLASRVEEVQQTLDLHGGRLDRIEDNQRRQSEQLAGLSDQLAEVLTLLRGLGPSD